MAQLQLAFLFKLYFYAHLTGLIIPDSKVLKVEAHLLEAYHQIIGLYKDIFSNICEGGGLEEGRGGEANNFCSPLLHQIPVGGER